MSNSGQVDNPSREPLVVVGGTGGSDSKPSMRGASPPPILNDEDDQSDVDMDAGDEDDADDEKSLDARFTPEQLEYLYSQKEAYRHAPAKQRREISRATGLHFAKEVQKAGRDPSKREIAALYAVSTPENMA